MRRLVLPALFILALIFFTASSKNEQMIPDDTLEPVVFPARHTMTEYTLSEYDRTLSALEYKRFKDEINHNDLEALKIDFGKGLDIHALSEYREPVIFDAAYNNNFELIKFLLDSGADINERSLSFGETLVSRCAQVATRQRSGNSCAR